MANVQLKCPHCGSSNFIKNGHDKFKNQIFFCKDCK
ncbi:MAG: transposase, partial [Fervidobacterium sp.]